MEKYGVSNVCPKCTAKLYIDMIKLSDGTKQENASCQKCGFSHTVVVSDVSSQNASE